MFDFVPTHLFLTKRFGRHKYQLKSFEEALRKAGVAQQNLVQVSSILGHEVDMHKYAVQITVADARDGACSSSTLKKANSWGKVDMQNEQMVYAEATSVLPLIASYVYHCGEWKIRYPRKWARIFYS